MDKTNGTNIFKTVQKTCRENKVREFHFKFIHRMNFLVLVFNQIVIVYIVEIWSSIGYTFSECQFTEFFTEEVLQWFNTENNSEFNLNIEDFIFGTFPNSSTLIKTELHPPLSAVLYL